MAHLKLLHYPDPRLRNKAKPVESINNAIERLIDDMFATMYNAPGIGLAAVQVDIALQIVVLDVSLEKTNPICLINPCIEPFGEMTQTEEGCLSVPGVYETVHRHSQVTVQALDRKGNPLSFDAADLLAVCIQHEVDHLSGILFVEHLSRLKQQRIKKKASKNQRITNN